MNLEEADDGFHKPATPDRYWTETSWWSFWVPERRLSGTIYNLFRPNLGIVSSDVYLWDDTSTANFDALYHRPLWHLEIRAGDDPTNFALASGLSIERLEPLRRHRMRYDDGAGRCRFDLVAEGVCKPHWLERGFGTEAAGTGHFDQITRVTGTLRLHGEELAVDCLAIRDRSWHVRSELNVASFSIGYTYGAASPALAFQGLAPTIPTDPTSTPDDTRILSGFLVRDGVMRDVVGGRRRILERRRGAPARLALDLEDRDGRTLRAEGRCVNQYAFFGSPFNLCWFGLTRWTLDGGAEAWGEDQDCWGPPMHWREHTRGPRGSLAG